ncbi:hypothetical protein [Leisingera sp. S232]|uniref:hypothetical protein n=1 Tax=Leisingera sp. S232 TaxID=3415132 RepID=UPI003C7E59CB
MRLATVVASLAISAFPVFASEFAPAMEDYYASSLSGWVQSPDIVSAIQAQNAANANLGQSDIDALDQDWRANVGDPGNAIIKPVLSSALADALRERVEASGGVITEIFVMDLHGLNVAASGITSDMWQGDEAKFQKTYGAGAGAVHYSEVELDESTQSYQGQISVTISDPASGNPIGAITVGVDAESLI